MGFFQFFFQDEILNHTWMGSERWRHAMAGDGMEGNLQERLLKAKEDCDDAKGKARRMREQMLELKRGKFEVQAQHFGSTVEALAIPDLPLPEGLEDLSMDERAEFWEAIVHTYEGMRRGV